jgi:hypothetical protein
VVIRGQELEPNFLQDVFEVDLGAGSSGEGSQPSAGLAGQERQDARDPPRGVGGGLVWNAALGRVVQGEHRWVL